MILKMVLFFILRIIMISKEEKNFYMYEKQRQSARVLEPEAKAVSFFSGLKKGGWDSY